MLAALRRTQLRRALRTWREASGVTAENEDGPPEIASIGSPRSKSHGDALEAYDAETSLLCARLSLLLPWLSDALPAVRIIGGREHRIFTPDIMGVFIRIAGEAYGVESFGRIYNKIP